MLRQTIGEKKERKNDNMREKDRQRGGEREMVIQKEREQLIKEEIGKN